MPISCKLRFTYGMIKGDCLSEIQCDWPAESANSQKKYHIQKTGNPKGKHKKGYEYSWKHKLWALCNKLSSLHADPHFKDIFSWMWIIMWLILNHCFGLFWTVMILIVVVKVFHEFGTFMNTSKYGGLKWDRAAIWHGELLWHNTEPEPFCVSSVFIFSYRIRGPSLQTLWHCLSDSYKTTSMYLFRKNR